MTRCAKCGHPTDHHDPAKGCTRRLLGLSQRMKKCGCTGATHGGDAAPLGDLFALPPVTEDPGAAPLGNLFDGGDV